MQVLRGHLDELKSFVLSFVANKVSRLETVQVLRDEEAETICVCQEGFTGDPDSKGEPFLFGFTARNKKWKEDNVIFAVVGTG